jgi:hypothetical protein
MADPISRRIEIHVKSVDEMLLRRAVVERGILISAYSKENPKDVMV